MHREAAWCTGGKKKCGSVWTGRSEERRGGFDRRVKDSESKRKKFLTILSHDSTLTLASQFHYVCKTGKLGKT